MSSDGTFNVIIAGVGGQGNVLAIRLLGTTLLAEGFEVSVGDVYGLSQRGGSVASHLRFHEERPLPPLVPEGRLDVLIGFEPLEAARVLCAYGHSDTKVLVNEGLIPSIGMLLGQAEQPSFAALFEQMRSLVGEVSVIDAGAITRELQSPQTMNMVMLGAISGLDLLPLSRSAYEEQIRSMMAGKNEEMNLAAFARGYDEVRLTA